MTTIEIRVSIDYTHAEAGDLWMAEASRLGGTPITGPKLRPSEDGLNEWIVYGTVSI